MGARANHMAARTNLCKASGQMGTDSSRIGDGVSCSALARVRCQLLLAPGGFWSSQIPQIRRGRNKGQSAGILLV